jgi:hypothetical protein
MRYLLCKLAALVIASAAAAAEPSGCDKFAWPLAREQQLLGTPQPVRDGAELDRDAGQAVSVKLLPLEAAKLPFAPEHQPKKASAFFGYLRFGKASSARSYKVTLSEGAWIDMVQDGHFLKPTAFSGATDCPHLRKSVKFEVGPAPFILQLSDAPTEAIAVVMTPAD